MGGSRFRFRVIFGWIRDGGLGRLIYCRVCHALYSLFYFVDELIDEFRIRGEGEDKSLKFSLVSVARYKLFVACSSS